MRRFRAIALLVACVLVVLVPAAPGRADVVGAGLVVRYADGSTSYAWVPLGDETISGLELLRRSGLPLVTTGFGSLGEAVCSIGGDGCSVAECGSNLCQSSADSPYWQYFRATDSGWKPMIFGASGTKVRAGDVDLWEWTAGDASVPALTAADVRDRAGAAAGDGRVVLQRYDAAGEPIGSGVKSSGVAAGDLGAGLAGLLVIGAAAVAIARRNRRAAA